MYLNLEKKTVKTITIRIIQTPKTKNLTPKKSPPPLKITIHEITPKNKHKLKPNRRIVKFQPKQQQQQSIKIKKSTSK
jgi:hypothetical protein